MNNLKVIAPLLALIILFSCNRNESNLVEVDFLINGEELQSLGNEYGEDDYSLYQNDPDKIFYASINESVTFKDVTIPAPDNRNWYLDNEEWNTEKLEAESAATFTHTFRTPGLYKVKLQISEDLKAIKLVRVLDKSSNSITVESRSKSDSEKAFSDIARDSERENGDIGDFEVFDFAISNPNPEKWEAIVLEDISATESKITKRLWDFGDGTIIPTKGPKVKYSYARSGVYEVKMCLNMTNNCKRKKIVVRELSKSDKDKPVLADVSGSSTDSDDTSDSPSRTKNSKRKPLKIQSLAFDLPAKVQAGLPVRIKDLSYPEDAINSRSWYIDGEKQFFHQRTVNHIFDTPGTYQIKMCLNRKKDNCILKTINVYQNEVVEDKEEVAEIVLEQFEEENDMVIVAKEKIRQRKIEYIPITSKPSQGFMCQSYGKAGLKAKYKCTTNKTFYYGNAIVNITPTIDLELQNAEIYGESDGYMDVFLLDEEFTEIGRIKNVQVLPGYSTIEFADLAFTLEKGRKYSILMKPKTTRRSRIGLENASDCKVPAYFNEDLQVEYQGKAFVMYDIKYCF